MKNYFKFLITSIAVMLSTQTFAQQLIPFQARLTDGVGTVVADGVYAVNFNIYDAATAGTALWTESHSTVSVIGGVVNVILGSITSLNDPDNDGDSSDAVNFYTTDGDRFIGVTIGDGQEMVPRHQLITSFQAVNADHAINADKLGNKLPEYYSFPSGSIMMFDLAGCPSGWQEYAASQGRTIIGKPAGGNLGGTQGIALTNLQQRTITDIPEHNHSIQPVAVTVNNNGNHDHSTVQMIGDNNIDGVDSTTTRSGEHHNETRRTGASGDHNHTAQTLAGNTDNTGNATVDVTMPYIQLLVCRRN